jgi:hypothetical protein
VAMAWLGAAVLLKITNTAARTNKKCFKLLNVSSMMMCRGGTFGVGIPESQRETASKPETCLDNPVEGCQIGRFSFAYKKGLPQKQTIRNGRPNDKKEAGKMQDIFAKKGVFEQNGRSC